MKSAHFHKRFGTVALIGALAGFSACGYTLQTSKSTLADRENVHRVYIAPIINNTYKPGAENVVYNALLRTLKAHAQVELASSKESADAVLQGTVDVANYAASAATIVPGPNNVYGSPVIASEYTANLNCTFILTRVNPPPGKRPVVWASSFVRAKPFPASNQLYSAGTTSALINESEFDRALSDISLAMMADVDESMLSVF